MTQSGPCPVLDVIKNGGKPKPQVVQTQVVVSKKKRLPKEEVVEEVEQCQHHIV